MKSQEDLNAPKKEAETLNNKLTELTEEELAQAVGGAGADPDIEAAYEAYRATFLGNKSNKPFEYNPSYEPLEEIDQEHNEYILQSFPKSKAEEYINKNKKPQSAYIIPHGNNEQ